MRWVGVVVRAIDKIRARRAPSNVAADQSPKFVDRIAGLLAADDDVANAGLVERSEDVGVRNHRSLPRSVNVKSKRKARAFGRKLAGLSA